MSNPRNKVVHTQADIFDTLRLAAPLQQGYHEYKLHISLAQDTYVGAVQAPLITMLNQALQNGTIAEFKLVNRKYLEEQIFQLLELHFELVKHWENIPVKHITAETTPALFEKFKQYLGTRDEGLTELPANALPSVISQLAGELESLARFHNNSQVTIYLYPNTNFGSVLDLTRNI